MANCRNCGADLPEGAQFCPKCGTPISGMEEPVSTARLSQSYSASSLDLAFWWERFFAWLIDVVIIGVISWFIGLIAAIATFTLIPGWPSWVPFFRFDINGILLFLYWMLMEGSGGQSFGKMIMRIKVVKIDGAALNMADAAIESVGKAFLLPIDLLIGWILYPRKRQRIFNFITRTIVIKVT